MTSDAGDVGGCWCMEASIPAALLERVPPELGGLACICKACVEAHHLESKDGE